MENKVTNPLTGKKIIKGGKTYFELVKKGILGSRDTKALTPKFVKKVRNPETGRLIKINGGVYTSLRERGILSKRPVVEKKTPEYSPLASYRVPSSFQKYPVDRTDVPWGVKEPHTPQQRRFIKQKCGDSCFLLPDYNKFPICNKDLPCTYNCRGIKGGASPRAGEWGYTRVLERSKQLSRDFKCYK